MTQQPPEPRGDVTLILQQVSAAAEASLAGASSAEASLAGTSSAEASLPGGPPAESNRARLFELVYEELRRIAGALMRRERQGSTLQPTALVHEAFLRLVDQTSLRWNDRAHFLGIAARAMRMILIDHARASSAAKRGAAAGRAGSPRAVGDRPTP